MNTELDFGFRPETYWEQKDPIQAILAGVKGEQRRRLVLSQLETASSGEIPEPLLAEPERRTWGAIHPLLR